MSPGICEGLSVPVSRAGEKQSEQGLYSMRMISSHFDNETAVIMVYLRSLTPEGDGDALRSDYRVN